MANTYIWLVEQMQVKKLEDQFQDVVYNIWWRCNAIDEFGNGATQYGVAYIPFTADNPDFIPYENLTENDVLVWVKNVVGENTVETSLGDELATKQALSNEAILPLPWEG